MSDESLIKAIRQVNTFAPKEYKEVIVQMLRDFGRMACKFDTWLDSGRGNHCITVIVFPEGADEPLWYDVILGFSFPLETFDPKLLVKMQLEQRIRHSALAFARWCQKAEMKLVTLDEQPSSVPSPEGDNKPSGETEDKAESGKLVALPSRDRSDSN